MSYTSLDASLCVLRVMQQLHTHTHTRLTAFFPWLPGLAGTRKVKLIWILLEQEKLSGICIRKSAPRSRQKTTPAPHRSVFYRPDALPAAQPTASKHWRQSYQQQLWCSSYQLINCWNHKFFDDYTYSGVYLHLREAFAFTVSFGEITGPVRRYHLMFCGFLFRSLLLVILVTVEMIVVGRSGLHYHSCLYGASCLCPDGWTWQAAAWVCYLLCNSGILYYLLSLCTVCYWHCLQRSVRRCGAGFV